MGLGGLTGRLGRVALTGGGGRLRVLTAGFVVGVGSCCGAAISRAIFLAVFRFSAFATFFLAGSSFIFCISLSLSFFFLLSLSETEGGISLSIMDV